MSVKTPLNCPRCGAALPIPARAALCPRCVMAMNVATPTELPNEHGSGPNPSATIPPTPAELAPKFPQLEIIELIGRGGMGVVYKARQKALDRLVALKLLAPEREKDPQFSERFVREAKTLAQLNHPNIVTVHDFGEVDGLFYLLMEYVDGANLRRLLGERKLESREALEIVPVVCGALQFAHDRGVVHRDIKPENILLDKEGRVKIADFGIARILDRNSANSAYQDAVVGTPRYMAPEQKSAPQTVDSRADIYSLGVVFYEMLTGELPGKALQPPSSKVRIDVRLDEVVLRALENSPELRYQTATDFRTQIETVASTPISGPRASNPDGVSILGKFRPAFNRHATLLFGLGLLVSALVVGWFLLKATNQAHRERYAVVAARIPELQQQWSVAKFRESVARQNLDWFRTRSTNGQSGDELRETATRRGELQHNLDAAIQQGRDAQAQIAATHEALGQFRYPFARILWPVVLLLASGFFLILRPGARRSPAWPVVAISAPIIIALLGLIVFSLLPGRQASPKPDEGKANVQKTIQTANEVSTNPAATPSP